MRKLLCKERALHAFNLDPASWGVNVQPYSGSPANLAIYFALCEPGDAIMGLGLASGGHLTHGHAVSITGKYFKSVPYGLRAGDARIDMDQVRDLARANKPKLIFCGTTAYPRAIDFAAFAEIAREVGAKLAADISHISGTFVVASMVRFADGRPDKDNYRRFQIKSFIGNDDFRAFRYVQARDLRAKTTCRSSDDGNFVR